MQLLSTKINTHIQPYAHKPKHKSTCQNQGDKASGIVLILTCERNLKIYYRRQNDKELAFFVFKDIYKLIILFICSVSKLVYCMKKLMFE